MSVLLLLKYYSWTLLDEFQHTVPDTATVTPMVKIIYID